MTIQLEQYPAAERKRLVSIGEDFGSGDTIAQATKTLQAFEKFKDVLVGFTAEDAQELEEARELLLQQGVARGNKQGINKVSRKDVLEAFKSAKPKRASARAVLSSARRALVKQAGTESAVQTIDVVLSETSFAGADADVLGAQLSRLASVLETAEIAEATKTRKGPEVVAALKKSIDDLQTKRLAKTAVLGTPEETERINLLDGIIVSLAREARRAARAASSETGNKAIATEFELTALYPAKPSKAPNTPEEK